MSNKYTCWVPVDDLPPFFGSASLIDRGGHVSIILHPGVYGYQFHGKHLRFDFGRVIAYMGHGEFSHPWNDEVDEMPKGADGNYTHPCLMVEDSKWLATFSDKRLFGWKGVPKHYQFVTLDETIDLVAIRQPSVAWIDAETLK